MTVIGHTIASETKELHGLDKFDGYHQLGNGESVQRLGKTGTNPGYNGRATYLAQSRVGAIAEPKEWAMPGRPMRWAGHWRAKW